MQSLNIRLFHDRTADRENMYAYQIYKHWGFKEKTIGSTILIGSADN